MSFENAQTGYKRGTNVMTQGFFSRCSTEPRGGFSVYKNPTVRCGAGVVFQNRTVRVCCAKAKSYGAVRCGFLLFDNPTVRCGPEFRFLRIPRCDAVQFCDEKAQAIRCGSVFGKRSTENRIAT